MNCSPAGLTLCLARCDKTIALSSCGKTGTGGCTFWDARDTQHFGCDFFLYIPNGEDEVPKCSTGEGCLVIIGEGESAVVFFVERKRVADHLNFV